MYQYPPQQDQQAQFPPPTPAPSAPPPPYVAVPPQNAPAYGQASVPASSYPPEKQPQQPMTGQLTQDQLQNMTAMLQSMPPEKLQAFSQSLMPQQAHAQIPGQPVPMQPQPSHQSWGAPPVVGPYIPPAGPLPQGTGEVKSSGPKDEKKTGKVQRFFGDTLVGRFARASVQTASSTLKMPAALSPWGDNNPVTLPNVRYRDAVLFTTFAFVGAPLVDGIDSGVSTIFGADSFISEIVSSGAGAIAGSTILKYGVFQIVEQAIDKGILEHMLPEEEKMIQTTNCKSLQVGIKHKLMGVDADLRFVGIYPTRSSQACEKGWFCPYLFASARTPLVPRANDFAIAQCFGPFLGGDYAMAHKLVAESASVLSLCDPDPNNNIYTNRMVVLFTGITPYRASMWSTSRRPGCGTLIFHLLDGCPALVIPVNNRAPIVAWSPWTLSQMKNPTGSGYRPEWHHEQICEWLDTVISLDHLKPEIRPKYEEVLGRSVSLIINGALALQNAQKSVLGKLDSERAGVVMFRY